MSIKRLAPEAVETFSIVLHPKRRYSARADYLVDNRSLPENALLTEAGEPLVTESGEYLIHES